MVQGFGYKEEKKSKMIPSNSVPGRILWKALFNKNRAWREIFPIISDPPYNIRSKLLKLFYSNPKQVGFPQDELRRNS
jgi:hypothetical protein